MMRALARGAAAGALLAGLPAGALAQQAAEEAATSGGLGEIVVTAQRREQSVQDVPIAVSAFSAAALETRGITETLDLIGFVPNMVGSNNTGLGSANAYYIRGLGNTETIATFDPPVGTYIDDVYISRQNANNFAFFDVERVEVLRGPQGTLFGRNTTGGAVNVIMKRPGSRFGGFVEAGYGSYSQWMVRGSVDLPASDMVGIKVSGFIQDDEGYVRNTTTGERLNDNDMAGARFAVELRPVERMRWHVALAWMEANGENLINFECDPRAPTSCGGRFATTGMISTRRPGGAPQYTLPVTGRKASFPLGNEAESILITSNLEWAGDNHTLNLITGYVDVRQRFALDFADGRALPNIGNPFPVVRGFQNGGFAILNDGKHQQFTQEVKLTGTLGEGLLDYVAGVYFYDEKNVTDFADMFTVDIGSPTGLPLLLADRVLRNGTKATAGYVQVDLNFAESFTATAGIRYTDEEKTFSIRDNRPQCPATGGPITCLNNSLVASNGVPIPLTQNAKLWTPRFALNWRANEEILVFASATRGFKSGGWNARGTRRDTLLPFDPEIAWNYELGLKSEWLDRRLRVNLTGFFLDVKALQTPSAFVNPVDGSVTFITQNFADYENKGLELELTAVPVDGLNLYLNLGYQDDRYKVAETLAPNAFGIKAIRQQQADCRAQLAAGRLPLAAGAANAPDCGAGIVTVDGGIATPVRTPDWTLAFGGSWDIPVEGAGIIIQPNANALYRSKIETGTANATIWTGSITSAATGQTFPTNPFAGEFVAGSFTRAVWLVNAGLSVRTDDGNWLVAVECSNCFDEAFSQSSLVNYNYLNRPRTWMARLRRTF
jgi:iron complex outermembrane receptor protein